MHRFVPSRRSLCSMMLGSVLGLVAALPAQAEGDAAAAKRNVNLSALQTMLAQQVSKAACFAALGIHPQAQARYLRGAHELFERTRVGLREGNSALGLLPETRQSLLLGLDRVDRTATAWTSMVNAVPEDGSISEAVLGSLLHTGEAVSLETQAAAVRSERAYGAGQQFALSTSLRLSIAGRQRVLSQRIAKDFCLIALGHEAEKHRAALAEAVKLFDDSQTALIEGFAAFGLPAESDPEVLSELQFVAKIWAQIRPALVAVAAGQAPSQAGIEDVAWQNNLILVQMNKAVFAYERGAES
ncbi:MAG: type IV pili methyl-accepting chemotaxis transducer N-terminal domain-containing protein [Pseudomonadota bacterium]